MNKWTVYGFLKTVNGRTNANEIFRFFPSIEPQEVTEGLEIYNEMAERSEGYYSVTSLYFSDAEPSMDEEDIKHWKEAGSVS